VTTTAGRALVLALPTGSVLRLGSVLHVAADWYVVVEGALEPVLAFTPASPEEALRVAFEVGNRHFTLALDGERVLVPDDPAMGICSPGSTCGSIACAPCSRRSGCSSS